MKWKLLAWAVPAVALVEAVAHVWFARRAPRPAEWAASRPVVAAAHRPGDPVVVAPYWAEPVARWQLGDDLFPLREVGRPDMTRYARAVELSAMGQRAPELRGWREVERRRAGRIDVRILENPSPARVAWDLTDHVQPPDAEAEVDRAGRVTRCAWTDSAPVEAGGLGGPQAYPASRFVCPGEPTAIFVGITVITDEAWRPRRCVWAHPPPGGETVARFRSVPLGAALRGHMGIAQILDRDLAGTPVTLRVVVGGEEVGRAVRADGEGWKLFEVPLGAHAGRTEDVEIRTSSPNANGRHICWEADTRD